ncbi:DUF1330 domain-containing protein [Paracnuella aquatica]|uniref:DUF1330 domain-containing protein n=1 Tax=Paracnuella aquatica TaxID=2268757 RepID=UPI000DEF45AD|nr:DUF1330 domain-containing protein [Paracnuella aquatica]RPD51843.1 DUF1330 domain-containing protein [Paracnuella aquatica]
MLYITQLVYIIPGQEKVFDEFEQIAIPQIAQYNGQLLFRLRPERSAFIEASIEEPYEIHIATFPSQDDFEKYKNDKERRKFLHLKEQSVKATILIQGVRL